VIAMLGAIESLLSARVADGMAHQEIDHDRPKHQPNKELFGQGLATIASVFSGGLPATGAIARTSVNVHAGARTRLAAMVHSIFLLLVVLILAPIVSFIPTSVLAGVLLGTSLRIANPRSVKEALQTTSSQRLVYFATALAVLFIDLIWGVVIGLIIDYAAKKIERRRS
jgi:SulP family sulfate permease